MNQEDASIDAANPRLCDTDVEALAQCGTRARLDDGDPLFQAALRRGGFFVVLSGAVELLGHSSPSPRRVALYEMDSSRGTSTSCPAALAGGIARSSCVGWRAASVPQLDRSAKQLSLAFVMRDEGDFIRSFPRSTPGSAQHNHDAAPPRG